MMKKLYWFWKKNSSVTLVSSIHWCSAGFKPVSMILVSDIRQILSSNTLMESKNFNISLKGYYTFPIFKQ